MVLLHVLQGHCVVVFNDDGQFQRRIGTDSITNFPNGIDISDAGDILVGDSHGNRFHVAVFQRDGSLIGELKSCMFDPLCLSLQRQPQAKGMKLRKKSRSNYCLKDAELCFFENHLL